MIQTEALATELGDIVGDRYVTTGPQTESFLVDGRVPVAAVQPASAEQVAEVLRLAYARSLAVVPWGGGTLMALGNLPARYDIALSLNRLDQVIEHEAADLTVTVQAGITLANLQRSLAKAGQFLPLDPAFAARATIGGILAANASGPWRSGYGTARDWTIGMKVVTADGRITKAGGKVVKNVAGYDLCKLYIGSLGTLAVLVEATFKLAPLPKAEASLILGFPEPRALCKLVFDLQQQGLSLHAAELLDTGAAKRVGISSAARFHLALLFGGTGAAVERSLAQARQLASESVATVTDRDLDNRLWESIRNPPAAGDDVVLCKLAVKPSKTAELILAIKELPMPTAEVTARPACGAVYTRAENPRDAHEATARLRECALAFGGALVIEACPPQLKEEFDVFGDTRGDLPLMRRLKQQFDPNGLLNPGRFVGRL